MCFSLQSVSPSRPGFSPFAAEPRWLPSLLTGGKLSTSRFAKRRKSSVVGFNASVFVPELVGPGLEQRYGIIGRAGSGAHGTVSLANDLENVERRVAIKRLDATCGPGLAAIKKEVDIMKRLDHPNICKLFETYQEKNSVAIVMEYCAGGDLYEVIRKFHDEGQRGIGEELSAHVVRQVAHALKYAHGKGVVHRDLKPENICFPDGNFGSRSHIKVIDWGISSGQGLKRMHTACGTLLYSAPEVIQANLSKHGYTAACDLYSLGVVLFGALSGTRPFGGHAHQQLKEMMAENVVMSGPVWDKVSPSAKTLIRGLLRARPEQRLGLDAVLAHAWLKEFPVVSVSLDSMRSVLSRMQRAALRFGKLPLLCAAAYARQLGSETCQDIAAVFEELDTDCNGVLSFNELQHGFQRAFGKESADAELADSIFDTCDLGRIGSVTFTDFCAAGLVADLVSDKVAMQAVFANLCRCGSSTASRATGLTKSKFAMLLGAHSKVDVDVVFASSDITSDQVFGFEEWLLMFQNI